MTRTDAREILMQMLFQMGIQKDYSKEAKNAFLKDKELKEQLVYFNAVYNAAAEHEDEIVRTFEAHSSSRKFARLSNVDAAIFRIAISEILYCDDIPAPVSVNEAVELAKKYSTDESAKLINAILKKIKKDI